MSGQNRRGFALPAAIGSLVIVGVLVTVGFYVARQELRIGVASQQSCLALNMAQCGVNDILVNYTSTLLDLDTWDVTTLTDTVEDGFWDATVTKMASRLFFIDVTAEVTSGGAMWAGAAHRVGVVARVTSVDISPPAALTTQGALKFGGSAEVHGADEVPDGTARGQADWTALCDSTNMVDKPGILIDDTLNIDWTGELENLLDSMTGDPLFAQDTTMTFESLTTFGDLSWDEMASLATIQYTSAPGDPAPVETNGICDTTVKDNWGNPLDPTHVCFDYFPLIYVNHPGSVVRLNKGIGQGILMVEGDISVAGGFEFYGPVFVKGTLTTTGSGGHFWGGVVAGNANLESNTVLGNATITYSTCAVERALLNNSALTQIRPLTMRSWVDLTRVGN